MENEIDKFVNDLPGSDKIFDINDDLKGEVTPPDGQVDTPIDTPDEDKLPFAKNPKVQRFIEKKVKAMLDDQIGQFKPVETKVIDNSTNTDVPYEWLAMYGDNEDSRKAWKFQSKLMDDYKTRAKDEALAEFRSEQERATAETAQFQSIIEDSLDSIEDEFNVDLTSNSPAAKKARGEYLDLVQRLSPKDGAGNVTSYADFHEVWDIYQASKVAPNNSRQKELASRSTTKANEAPAEKVEYKKGMGFDGIKQMLNLDN